MIRLLLCVFFLTISKESFSQKFGYVNSEFILNSMPEYKDALSEIENLSKAWEKEVSDMYTEVEKKEVILKNEEILLTKEMYEEKRIQLQTNRVGQFILYSFLANDVSTIYNCI